MTTVPPLRDAWFLLQICAIPLGAGIGLGVIICGLAALGWALNPGWRLEPYVCF